MISRNSAWSIAGSALPAATALLAIPTLFFALGNQLFSICSLLISLAIFFFVYDFGIARSITYFIAKSDLERNSVNAACGQGTAWACFFSCIAAFIIFSVTPWFVAHWLEVDLVLRESVVESFRIAAYGIPASVLCHVFRGILEGHSDFRAANLGKIIAGASIFLAPFILVKLDISHIQDLSLAITCTRYVSLGFYIFLTWGKVDFKKTSTRIQGQESLISYAGWAALSGFISTLFIYGDRFFVAGYVEAEMLAIYIGSQDILIRYLLIPWSMATVLLPVFAAGKLAKNEESKFYLAHQKKILWLSIAFIGLVWAGIILIDWLSLIQLNHQAKLIISLQAIGVFFAALSQMPLILLLAKGKPRLLANIYAFEFLIYMMIAPTILSFANSTGAGILWAGRLIMEYCLLSYAMNKKRISISV